MKKFNNFIFESYSFDLNTLKANFIYSFDSIEYFEENIDFGSQYYSTREDIDEDIINQILFHIHIALGISYYKVFPTEKLIIKSGELSPRQIDYWGKFYRNGLGEFLYTNNIPPYKLFNFENNKDFLSHKGGDRKKIPKKWSTQNRSLLPLGGGKDSIVSLKLLENSSEKYTPYIFGKSDIIKDNCLEILGNKPLLIKRKISKNLFQLNELGYYNGHVPISGMIAFVSILVSYLYDYRYIIMSNEKSANIGNTFWKGLEINHQYSKSLEFEQDLRKYIEEFIMGDTQYFSLLRGMYEYFIAKLFVKYGKDYFRVFSSCNKNFTINKENPNNKIGNSLSKSHPWCNKCPKCVFVYSILSAFLSREDMISIFGKDLYEDEELENLFRELLGIIGIKPFECVGEKSEMILSMKKSLDRYIEEVDIGKLSGLPYILKMYEEEIVSKISEEEYKKLEEKLGKIYDEDIIPEELKKKIFFD